MDKFSRLLTLVDRGAEISTDTRTIKPGDIFFALKGENFDGNAFAQKALKGGAIVAVVDDPEVIDSDKYILVSDVLETLKKLGNLHRNRFDIPVIGITGTNGKTTTKELLNAVLSEKYNVLATRGNLNSQIGVPLTLLSLKPGHELAIIEMGASEPGEIRLLAEIAEPTIGLITNVGKAHIEGFGSEQVICETKAGLYDFLSEHSGTSLIPEAIHTHAYFRDKQYINGHSFSPDEMHGKSVDRIKVASDFPFVGVVVEKSGVESVRILSRLFGEYNFDNLVNVIKIADYFGLTHVQWKSGIEKYQPKNNRSQVVGDALGNTLILDAYNANPSSVARALDYFLVHEDPRKKVLILGDMLELGEIAHNEHQKVIQRLAGYPDIEVKLVGATFHNAFQSYRNQLKHIHSYALTSEAKSWWANQNIKNSLVLVKGSRGIALESLFTPD